MKARDAGLLVLAGLLVVGVSIDDGASGDGTSSVEQPSPARPTPRVEVPVAPGEKSRAPSNESTGLRQAAGDGDGDSWHDTAGREYRLGLVNAPETGECFGAEATAWRKTLTSGGYRADVYATDAYGRSVSVVTLADGTNLNVWLARHGYADDRYLQEYRAENPMLAVELDAAFAAARSERVGLWRACADGSPNGVVQAPPAAPDGCHPDYVTCVPVKGDGSGNGAANDLDCGEVGEAVQLRQAGVDPYRLDREGDGVGCEQRR